MTRERLWGSDAGWLDDVRTGCGGRIRPSEQGIGVQNVDSISHGIFHEFGYPTANGVLDRSDQAIFGLEVKTRFRQSQIEKLLRDVHFKSQIDTLYKFSRGYGGHSVQERTLTHYGAFIVLLDGTRLSDSTSFIWGELKANGEIKFFEEIRDMNVLYQVLSFDRHPRTLEMRR